MNISTLLTILTQNIPGGDPAQPTAAVIATGSLDPANPPAPLSTSAADVYHGSDSSSAGSSPSNPIGQTGVGAYITVHKVTDMNALTHQWFSLISTGLGNPSGALRSDYQSAVSKLSPDLQKKDWGFSVNNGQLVFTPGKNKLSTQDLTDLENAFAGTGTAAAAQQVANATVALVSVARQMMPGSSTGIGSYNVTTKNFSDVVDLRAYLMSHGPDGEYGQNLVDKSDYSAMYQITGVYAMYDQISRNAAPNSAQLKLAFASCTGLPFES